MSFQENRTEDTTEETTKENEILQKLYQKVAKDLQFTEEKPHSRYRTLVRLATTTNQIIDEFKPDIIITNIKNVSKIMNMSLAFSENFLIEGTIVITVDDAPFFEAPDLLTFLNSPIIDIPIPKGLRIKRDTKIKVFQKSGNGTSVSTAVSVSYSD